MTNARSWPSLVALIVFIPLVAMYLLTGTGFCHSEMRYLSYRELAERYVLGENWQKMTEEERQQKLSTLENFPDCCRIELAPWSHTYFDQIMNPLFGRFFYGVETYFTNPDPDTPKEKYYYTTSDIDACGYERDLDKSGISASEDMYKVITKKNHEFWGNN